MENCFGCRQGSFLDNEVAFWGFHAVSEVFVMFFDVLEDVVQVFKRSSLIRTIAKLFDRFLLFQLEKLKYFTLP